MSFMKRSCHVNWGSMKELYALCKMLHGVWRGKIADSVETVTSQVLGDITVDCNCSQATYSVLLTWSNWIFVCVQISVAEAKGQQDSALSGIDAGTFWYGYFIGPSQL